MKKYETILYDKKGHVATITLNRPEKLNAMSIQLSYDCADAFGDAEKDVNIIALILTGTGRGFCAGADLSEVKMATEDPEMAKKRKTAPRLLEVMAGFRKPVIAAVNGVATAGGFELILYSDLVVASETARIGDAHANFVGIGPAATTIAPYKMNRMKAAELLLTGDIWPAIELEKAGLVNYVVPADKLMAKAEELANKIASHMPLAMVAAKDIMNRAGLSDPATLWAYVNEVEERISKTEDFKEGMRAFAEKRTPNFKGK
jgi:enoyl-CoA hydratase